MENKNMIVLKTDKELKILMSPVRQKIIKIMGKEGKPVTPKHIADKLEISPSSVQHHIKKLEEIGIIEFDHTELINGITARYIRLSEKPVSIGQDLNDDLSAERDVLAKSILSKTYNEFIELLNKKRKFISEEYKNGNKMMDQLSGVVHLTSEDANKLFNLIDDFVKSHAKASHNTHPFQYALIAFQADLIDDEKGKD